MDYSTWFKLLIFEFGKFKNKRVISFWEEKIKQYEDSTGDVLMENFLSDTEVVAKKIFDFIKAEEDKAKIESVRKQKEELDKNNKVLKDLLNSTRNKLIPEMKPESLEYQLGLSIGNFILVHYLPTLSIDGMQTNHVIDVSEEDTAENDRLQKLYDEKGYKENDKDSLELFNNWREHSKLMEDKYLPKVLDCVVHKLSSINKIDDFIKGIETVLWDCDCSHYGTKNIEIINSSHRYSSTIKLHR